MSELKRIIHELDEGIPLKDPELSDEIGWLGCLSGRAIKEIDRRLTRAESNVEKLQLDELPTDLEVVAREHGKSERKAALDEAVQAVNNSPNPYAAKDDGTTRF